MNMNGRASSSSSLGFTDKVKKCVYNNGVYPTQGVRPLFSTLCAVIDNAVPFFLMSMYKEGVDRAVVDVDEKKRRVFSSIGGKKSMP